VITSKEIKEFVINCGADKCGIANIERFAGAPEGFSPADVYKDCRSVIVFLKRMPTGPILAANPVPYTHTAYMLYTQLNTIGFQLSEFLQTNNAQGVPIPSDVPYIYWDEKNKHGQAIISLRHSAWLAGLGFLGRNTLLINEDLGNMGYIGAVLSDAEFDADAMVTDFECPPKCSICLDACTHHALNGITVDQKICREFSFYQNERGFDIYDCKECRKSCILRNGKRKLAG